MDLPTVSVVVPNLNGQQYLEQCIPAVFAQDYPADAIECLVVDNGSIDGSTYFLAKNYPEVKVKSLKQNVGFATAINLGARSACGEILFLLNNDARPAPDCLINLIEPIVSKEVVCTAAKIVSPDDQTVQFAGSGMNFHGIAFQRGQGEIDHKEHNQTSRTLFACGGAMAVTRKLFLDVGGFDDDFFAYFEDVDFGWRLWILGHQIQYVPSATAYHQQSGTSRFIDLTKIRVLHIRNPLMMIYKNYSDTFLQRILPVAWMLTMRRTLLLSSIDTSSYNIDREAHLAEPADVLEKSHEITIPRQCIPFPSIAVSDFVALNDWLSKFDSLREKRNRLQAQRATDDRHIVPMFSDPFRYSENDGDYRELQDQLCQEFGIYELFTDPSLNS